MYLATAIMFTAMVGWINFHQQPVYAGASNEMIIPEGMKMENMTDSKFLTDAYNTNLFEIQAGDLAADKTTNNSVKMFAEKMSREHKAMNVDVKGLAGIHKVDLPADLTDAKLKENLAKLKGLSGKNFDNEYVAINVKGHKECESMFEKGANESGYSNDVKMLAQKHLPKIRDHEKDAIKLQDKLKSM